MLSVNPLVFPVKAVGTTAAGSTAGTVIPMAEAKVGVAPKAAPGSQTLARGLSALELIAATPGGVTVQEIADRVGVHRTVAYRLLSTLVQFRLVARHDDGRYRPAA